MRIVYDATPLLLRSAGVKNYHYRLLTHLLPQMAPHRIQLFPLLAGLGEHRNEGSNYPAGATLLRLGSLLAANYLRLPVASWAARRADLFHITHHWLHPPSGCRLTSMVHDLTPLLMPEFHTASNVRYFRRFARHTLPRLAATMVPSQSARRDLVERLGVREERVTVVPHGVDADFFSARQAPGSYILFVGSREPRKNLATLLDACALLPGDLRRAFPLVVAGASGWKNKRLGERLEREKANGLRALGYVPREELPALYAGAALFVFPSLYEGFGMPLLEAMAAGVPVVTSNVSAMPEVVGDAGVTLDPRSPAEIRDAIVRVLSDSSLARSLGERGRQRARQFTWENTALATKAFFERAAG